MKKLAVIFCLLSFGCVQLVNAKGTHPSQSFVHKLKKSQTAKQDNVTSEKPNQKNLERNEQV